MKLTPLASLSVTEAGIELAASLALPAPGPSILDLSAGLHHDVPDTVYHQRILGVASKGALEHVLRSPATYRAWVDGQVDDEDSEPLWFGRAWHCAMLEPERFGRSYVIEPDFGDCRKKDNRERRDAWRAEHVGADFVSAEQHARIVGMAAAVHAHPVAGPMLHLGAHEVTARWTDPSTGIECKARGDIYAPPHAALIDLKSTADATAGAFAKTVERYGYHRQAGFYRGGFELAGGAPVRHFVFVVTEKTPPYLTAVYTLDEPATDTGRRQIRRALDTLARCFERDEWPGLCDRIMEVSLPRWAAE